MPIALNESDLQAMIMPKIQQALDYLIKKIWEENRDIVQQVVYDAYDPVFYNRTNQFKEAWSTDIERKGNHAEAQFFYDSSKLSVGLGGQHSSIVGGSLQLEALADIIYNGLAGDFTGHFKYAKENPAFAGMEWTDKRDAWDALQKKIGRVTLKKWLEEGFRTAGLNVKSHGGSWGLI